MILLVNNHNSIIQPNVCLFVECKERFAVCVLFDVFFSPFFHVREEETCFFLSESIAISCEISQRIEWVPFVLFANVVIFMYKCINRRYLSDLRDLPVLYGEFWMNDFILYEPHHRCTLIKRWYSMLYYLIWTIATCDA